MTLNELSILNFKNIAEAAMQFSPKINCFTGNNGMGKTNLLDAIHYLSFCKSCVSRGGDAAVIRHGDDMMLLQGNYERRGAEEKISIGLQRGKRKVAKRNGKEYQLLSRHIGLLPLVMVSPMDTELIRGSGDDRRRLINQIISQSDRSYLDSLIRYSRAIDNRNAMLKSGIRDAILFESVEEQIVASATLIHGVRKQWIEKFTPIFLKYYHAITGGEECVSLEYVSQLHDSSMSRILAESREHDCAVGFTTRGVHRDDIELMLGQYPMRKIGSQGQCKTYTIALRLAQFEFLMNTCGITPLLLLDDIFDKLDANRVCRIIDVVSGNTGARFGQIFITDTNRTHLDEIIRSVGSDYRIFHVDGGMCHCEEHGEGGAPKP